MNKMKQLLCIALTFILLGGCAQIQKDEAPAQTTVTQIVQATAQKTVTEPIAATEYTEKATEKQTATRSTAKPSTTAATTRKAVETTAKSTAAKPTATKPTTAKSVTTVPATTSATIQAATTATTVPVQSEDGIIIGFKRMLFGSGSQEIISAFGNPTETVTENLASGGTVKSLVYADDYNDFAVFQLLNGKFFGFYTCVRDTLVTDGEKSYSLRTGGEKQIGKVKITEFTDSQKSDRAYAFRANFNGFDYYPSQLEALDGQERLIFHATNALRAINGVSALEHSEKAADCVRRHCEDMSARNYFSHDTPEGVSSAQRMRNAGVAYTTCGENLAAGYEDAFGMANGWYNSAGHRKNMLDGKFRYVGVGVAKGNGSYQIYAGQNYYA